LQSVLPAQRLCCQEQLLDLHTSSDMHMFNQ
jgi:hypothetical protein